MGLQVDLEALIGDGGPVSLYRAVVLDDEYADLVVRLNYSVWNETRAVELRSFAVSTSPRDYLSTTAEVPLPFAASNLRDLPYVRWDSAARAKLAAHLNAETPTLQQAMTDFFDASGRFPNSAEIHEAIAGALLRLRHPGVEADHSPAGVRRYRSLRKMALTAAEYVSFLEEGRGDPAMAIAEKHGVGAATARSWVFRSRQEGFLPSAPTPQRSEPGSDPLVAAMSYMQAIAAADINRPLPVRAPVEPSFGLSDATAQTVPVTDQALRLSWLTVPGNFDDDSAARLAAAVEAELMQYVPRPEAREPDQGGAPIPQMSPSRRPRTVDDADRATK